MRRLNKFTVFAFAVALVSGACSNSSSPSGSTPSTVDHPPAQFVAGSCAKTPEPVPLLANARCGQLVVPVDRTKADGPTMRLAIAIIPSEMQPPTKEPIVFLQGGPGLDGIASPAVPSAVSLNHDRDLILFGQRGTQTSSTPLLCPEQDKFYAARVGLVYDAPATGELDAQAVKECRDRLAPTNDLAAYNSTESAYDLIDLRKALGLEKWAVFSHSYGTTLALIYVNMDGPAIAAVAYDGVTPPSVGGMAWTWPSARAAFDGVMQACEAQAACKDRYPGLSATFIRLVEQLEKNPATTTVDIPGHGATKVVIDGGTLLTWFVGMSGRLTAGIPAAIDELDHGNPQTVAMQYASGWVNTELSNATVATGLTLSIWCSEWVPFETPQASMDEAKKAFPDFPDSVLAQAPQLAFLREECAAWNVPKAADSVRNVTKSDIPSLVVTGSFDARTGPMWGEYIAKDLSHATVVVIPGWGHGVFLNPCGATVIASFFDDPGKPDTGCVGSVQIPDFTILPPRQ
ncbi:alpha/beta hydrolase [Antrihabitans stalactiti]|uniref:Alpha/beta fold hydrolase n=1 Tax=Antrihabitans stalactiti TaxID=2584121 RepID=A0A848KTJ9_9NOCA|nr:alpha/beta fold hydrolase [Antrihabitans stalactiti]NMN99490.1 alpha/beta fold hydrolase [Antrihabitans stalactiti]